MTAPRAESVDPRSADPLWGALGDLMVETMMFHRHWARRQGLSPLQFLVLKHLRSDGSLQPSAIADRFGISRSAVSGEINSLEEAGWVSRSHPEGNQRTRLTSLTAKARRVLDQGSAEYERELARGLTGVSASERRRLAESVTSLATQLRSARGIDSPPSRSGS